MEIKVDCKMTTLHFQEEVEKNFYEKRRKKTIDDYFISKITNSKSIEEMQQDEYNDSRMIPQLSHRQIEYSRENIEKFYTDNLDYVEYGCTSMFTIHSLYRSSIDGKVYNVFTTPKNANLMFEKNDNLPIEDENGCAYFSVIDVFPVNKLFLRNTFYLNLEKIQTDTGIAYYPGVWQTIQDDSIEKI
jgi:hypothetical protein